MRTTLFAVMLIITSMTLCGQDSLSVYDKTFNIPDKLFGAVHNKSVAFQNNIMKASYKYLNKLEKREIKMKRKVAKQDSAAASEIFGNVKQKYSGIRESLNHPVDKISKVYSGRVDSVKTAFNFLNDNKVFANSNTIQKNIVGVFKDYNNVQSGLTQSDFIAKQLKDRQDYLSFRLQMLSMGKSFLKFKQDVYYYRTQIDEYKKIFEDPAKLEKLIIGTVVQLPAFQSFFAKYSELGSIFRLPSNDLADNSINGMQTRQTLMQELGSQLGSGPNVQSQVSNSISGAQSTLRSLRDRFNSNQSNGDPDMPGFKPNADKTKSFFNKIELGFNIQSVKSNYFFPTTSDIGLSLGYRIRPNIICGLGSSYKVGWGKNFRDIRLTNEGVGLRSYAEVKLKGSFWITAGSEMNYYSSFKKIEELKDNNAWQKSLLAGLNKKYRIKKHKGEFKLLYDFYWNRHLPQTQPIIFRTGYSLNN